MGALSVVICAILSSIFLKERLTLFGKIGCFLCILGATIIALNGPAEQSARTILEVSFAGGFFEHDVEIRLDLSFKNCFWRLDSLFLDQL